MNAITETQETEMIDGYVAALCWVGLYEEGDDGEMEPVNADPYAYGMDDLADDLADEIRSDVADFVSGVRSDDLAAYLAARTAADFGHDFYLTRNGHGAGFWDRGLGDVGDRLADAARVYGEHSAFLGDDGNIQ